MIHMTYSIEKQVKHAGLHSNSARQWLASQGTLGREQNRARDFRAAILRYLRTEGAGHGVNDAVLGTSDVLESLFGKYKRYTDRSPETTLNSSILMVPIAMETLTQSLITQAIESTPIKALTSWCNDIFGRTKLGVHRQLSSLISGTEPAWKNTSVKTKFSTPYPGRPGQPRSAPPPHDCSAFGRAVVWGRWNGRWGLRFPSRKTVHLRDKPAGVCRRGCGRWPRARRTRICKQ